MRISRRAIVGLVVSATIALGSCGSSSTTSNASKRTAHNGTDSSSVAKPTQPPVSSAPSSTKSNSSTTPAAPVSGSFCAAVAKFKATSSPTNTTVVSDPSQSLDSLVKALQQAQPLLQNMASRAPAEIKADMDTVVKAFNEFIDSMRKDSSEQSQSSSENALSTPELTAAEKRVEVYVKQHCGIVLDSSE